MPQKNILYVAHSFPPAGGATVQRSTKFCKYLPDFGYRPLVLTCTEDAIDRKLDRSLLEEVRETPIFRCRGYERFLVQLPQKLKLRVLTWFFLRPDPLALAWVPQATRTAMDIAEKYPISAIFVTVPPHSCTSLGVRMKKLLNVPLVVDYRDFWTECTWSLWPTKFHHRFEMRQERRVLAAADAIVVVTPTMKDILARRYPQHEGKIHVIANGFDPEDIPDSNGKPNTGPLRIGFTGHLLNYDLRQHRLSKGPLSGLLLYANERPDFSTHTPLYLFRAVRALLDERPELESKISLSFAGDFGNNRELVNRFDLEIRKPDQKDVACG